MRFTIFSALALPIAAIATDIDVSARDECSGGQINCCNATMQSTRENLCLLSELLGFQLPNIGGLIGLTCTSIAQLNALNQQCNAQLVCCTNNSFNGLIALGCTAINL